MQAMQSGFETAGEWSVFTQMRGVLCKVGDDHASRQKTRVCDVSGDGKGQGLNWPGRDLGVRRPDADETPLSKGEVRFAIRRGLL